MSFIEIKDKAWYYFFNNPDKVCLVNSKIYNPNNFNICMEIKGTSNKICKVFSSFTTIEELYNYINLFDTYDKHFYEIILGSRKQKPHFDIDLDDRDENYIKYHKNENIDVVNSMIIKIITENILLINPFSIIKTYTSNSDNKRSTHIIISNCYHDNNIEANDFYNLVVDNIDSKYSTFIDKSVYKSVQQFRLLGSCKIDTKRVKICNFESKLSDFETFKESMVSNVDIDVSKISMFNNTQKIKYNINKLITNEEVDEILERFVKDVPDIKTNFKVSNSKNNIITLRRQRPSLCKQCKRIHEHENPFIIKKDNISYFYCRRGKKPVINTIFNDIINNNDERIISGEHTFLKKRIFNLDEECDDDELEKFNLKMEVGTINL